MEVTTYEVEVGGKTLTAEFTNLTAQAHGSVLVRYGETVVLVTAVMSARENGSATYFPLSVEFEERNYAVGKILGSRFMRREGRPSDDATLSARIIDRTIRPLFNHAIRNDIQVVATVLAMGEDDPDVLGVIGASLALSVSDIPWHGPVGAVRIAKRAEDGEIILNPTYTERTEGRLDFEVLACGKDGAINMIETAGQEIAESEIVATLERAVEINSILEVFQKKIVAEIGREKRPEPADTLPAELQALFDKEIVPKIPEVLFSGRSGKAHLYALKDEWFDLLAATLPDANKATASDLFEDAIDAAIHAGAVEKGVRADGRGMDDLRPLFARAGGVSPVLHGSGIFYRGETHIFSALTLGGPEDSQLLDTLEERETKKRFMHHYNFPPFSVGETGRVGGFNRRMIGHGALAEKALAPVIPSKETFPYTIRLVSETMSSNGSSSMGSVCGSTLALMDGGVPITRPVAGIASGIMMQDHEHYALLTDIQGPEDEHGDMDFKVAGTREGITAIQMDVKVEGIPVKILAQALEKARLARLQILDVIENEITSPRADISSRAPKILVTTILPEQIGLVIGSGGKTINGIKEQTGVEEISIEEDGTIFITGSDGSAERALEKIQALTRIFELGEKLDATITRVAPFGAFAKMNDTTEGLIHISEIVPWRLESVDDILHIGDVVPVVISKFEDGKYGLSIKKANPEWGAEHGLIKPE